MSARVKQRTCAVMLCRERTVLVPTKTFIPGALVEIDLCREHLDEHTSAIHAIFRERWGVDFVDPGLN